MSQHFIALAGNPNCGKTTAFNRYTGARQSVGNYPGVTVEKKEGVAIHEQEKVRIVDLPGTYSLTAYSQDEVITRRVLTEEHPGAVINLVNAGVLERNLYLTVQLLELGVPIVIALNMMDEAKKQGLNIDAKQLESLIGLKVVPTVARTGEGLDTALHCALELSKGKMEKPEALVISYGPDIDAVLMKMCPIIEKNNFLTAHYPARWVAIKYLEQDSEVMAAGQSAMPDVAEALGAIVAETARHLRATLQTYPEAVIADYRYGYISALLRKGVVNRANATQNRIALSDAADKILTHRILGPLILMLVLYGMYWLTFAIGAYPQEWMESAFSWLGKTVGVLMPEGMLASLVTSGIIEGVGAVLSFVPLIAIMFLLISLLEDSGYMARVAYMMDRIFRAFGLHGASVMPFIISGGIAGGCAIPGIMAARTLRSPKERLATILAAPFMVCGAKLPVFLLFVGIFFEKNQALIMFLLALTGWIVALITARILRSTIIRGEATPFIMELPPYRMPTLLGVCIHAWERIWEYIKKAGTIILAIAVLVWAAMTFPGLPEEREAHYAAEHARISQVVEDAGSRAESLAALRNAADKEALRYSFAGRLGSALEPVTQIAGFDWRTNIALIAGIAAKEVIVSTLGTVYSLGEVDAEDSGGLAERIRADKHWNTANAVALLLFVLLYSPCFPALAVIRSETKQWRWMFFSLFFNLAVAFSVSTAAYQLLRA